MNIVKQFIVNGEVVNVPDNTEQINTLEQKVDSNIELINANSVLITDHELRIKQLEDSSSEAEVLVNITYTDLLSLRNLSKLIPGAQYRITDYVTTSTEAETQVAGHLFDIIVTADSTNVLNENARACQHVGETYFNNSKLEAWQLKYCIDNDTDRFGWADEQNGKGVIYRMVDERGNSCPYDFKNIKFARNLGSSETAYIYTFSLGRESTIDFSMSDVYYVYNNYIGDSHIKVWHSDQTWQSQTSIELHLSSASGYTRNCIYTDLLQLPFILFFGPMLIDNHIAEDSALLTFAPDRVNNDFSGRPFVSFRGLCNYNVTSAYNGQWSTTDGTIYVI